MDVAARPERKTIELDWGEFPIRCPERDDLPDSDPRSATAVRERAWERALQAVKPHLADGWELDGAPAEAITFERQRRRIELSTPGAAGPHWEEYCTAFVKLRRP